jgi:hypothetical protein
MAEVHDIPKPDLLNPHRMLTNERDDMTVDEHRDRARELEKALQDSCEYGQQLWERLDALRHYLVESLPHQPAEGSRLGGAHPTGPDDEQGWFAWRNAYAAATSVLAGAHEDSGFGADEAEQIARQRLAFSGGNEPTVETVEGTPRADPDPLIAQVPAPPRGALAAGGFLAGAALGWVQGRTSGARRAARRRSS